MPYVRILFSPRSLSPLLKVIIIAPPHGGNAERRGAPAAHPLAGGGRRAETCASSLTRSDWRGGTHASARLPRRVRGARRPPRARPAAHMDATPQHHMTGGRGWQWRAVLARSGLPRAPARALGACGPPGANSVFGQFNSAPSPNIRTIFRFCHPAIAVLDGSWTSIFDAPQIPIGFCSLVLKRTGGQRKTVRRDEDLRQKADTGAYGAFGRATSRGDRGEEEVERGCCRPAG